eukprot:4850377-Heterocapsa_arctica.AAC.1
MDELTIARLQWRLQGRLRKVVLTCLRQLDLADPKSLPALLRLRELVAGFEARSGLDASAARSGKQWGRIKALACAP